MSTFIDDTAGDVPVRDVSVNHYRPAPPDSSVYQNARARQDISRISREELEDRFLHLQEETQHLKQHIHQQDDKIKKLGTKLMRLVNDRGRLERLAAGGGASGPEHSSRVRVAEMEEMVEDLQEKVRALQSDNEGLKRRLHMTRQQLISKLSRRPTPYDHVQPRINTGVKNLRSSPHPRPKSTRSLEGARRPPPGLLPRYGHSLLEDARAEIRNLENVVESQRDQMEEMEQASDMLRDELRKKEAEYEEQLLEIRQDQTSKVKSHINNNVTMIKLQKQQADRCNTITALEGRFLQLQESQRTLQASHDAAMARVDELSAQLKDERLKSLDLETRLQRSAISKLKTEQLRERITELEQEKDLLKDNNEKLVNSAFDVSQQQKWQLHEQQLKLQIAQLETALNADLTDKNEILDKIKAERDKNEKLTEEKKQLHIQFLEQKQQLDELQDRLKFYSKESEQDVAELTEALMLIKARKSKKSGDLGFLTEVEQEVNGDAEVTIRELRALHAETIQELEKTRNILGIERKISKDYKAELETVRRKLSSDKLDYEQRLGRQAQLLDRRSAKITKLEAQLRDIAYCTKAHVFKPDVADEGEADDFDAAVLLERGENLLEFQIVSASLSPSALEALGDSEPSTFCTYNCCLFGLHSTPVVTGQKPKYGYTSKCLVCTDEEFLEYLHSNSVTIELHQAIGTDWQTLATGRLPLQQLLEQDGKVHGTIPLIGTSDEVRSFGSLDYWIRLRMPMTEAIRLYKEKVKAVGYIRSVLREDGQNGVASSGGSENELFITVQCCRDLQSNSSRRPSSFVVYKFFDYPDYPTATVHDCCEPQFHDHKSYSVSMDWDLDQHLKSGVMQFYVFDQKEEQMDVYLGKARVPLLSLAQDKAITGVFELADPSGLPAGHIEVTLKWKSTYLAPPGSTVTSEHPKVVPREKPIEDAVEPKQESQNVEGTMENQDLKSKAVDEALQEKEDKVRPHHSSSLPDPIAPKPPLPKLRQKMLVKEGLTAKKVKFLDVTTTDEQVEERSSAGPIVPPEKITKVVPEVTPAPPSAAEEDDEEEVSRFSLSEGQTMPTSSMTYSDDSEISEEIIDDVEESSVANEHPSILTQSDSDDCIVHDQATGRKLSERVRVEISSLSLRPESRVSQDSSVVRLFVEYSFLDLPTEDTPLSLPKPPPGKTINFNYSKVIPVDVENSRTRRELLREVLQGRNQQMETIRFTVVSEPPEEEEHERECEDVGVAFLRIPEILEKQRDLTETNLNVVDVEDSSVVVGSLTVSLEGLEALRSIMEEPDQEVAPPSPL